MRALLVVWAVPIVALVACDRTSSSGALGRDAGVAASSSALPAECTGDTPLVPGVPGSPGHLLPSARNPNGVSELAALMREMEADWRRVRDQLHDAGDARPAGLGLRHSRMRCAWPTQPADRDRAFDARAASYLAKVRAFEAAPTEEAYGAVLIACRACHESVCTGALAAIDALAPVAR